MPRYKRFRPRKFRHRYPRYPPRPRARISVAKLTIGVLFGLIVIAVVCAFAGVQPLAQYKDKLIENFKMAQAERAQRAEEEKAQNLEALGHEVVDLVNAIRTEKGAAPLIWDNELYTYSKQHSEDMASQKRLFHTPVGESYAENAWGGEGSTSWTASDIVESWMSSPYHRTWLLCPHLQHVAVGIATSDNGMYASWTFWVNETSDSDWWYQYGSTPPDWWY